MTDKSSDESGDQQCERCGDSYDSCIVAIRDDFSSIVDGLSAEYDDLCKPCRKALHPDQAFAGADKVGAKEEVDQ